MDRKRAYEIDKKATEDFIMKKKLTIFWVHYNILEYFYGSENVLKILFDMLSMKRTRNANAVALTKPGQKINDEISNISDYKFKMISKDDTVLFYGIIPATNYYFIKIDREKGFPNVRLIPLL